jgi:ribosome-associated translation inhibitor RaiA
MQLPVQIISRALHLSKSLVITIRGKAEKLDAFYSRITRCRVVVESPTHHHGKSKSYDVRIDLTVPGSELVVNHHENRDLKIANRYAFDAVTRQLQDYAHQQGCAVKTHSVMTETRH